LHSITSYYLQQTCLLVCQYKSRNTCLNDWLEIPFRTKRYLGEIKYVPNDIRSINTDVLFTAYNILSSIVDSFKTNLSETLAKYILREGQIQEKCEFPGCLRSKLRLANKVISVINLWFFV